MTNFKAVLLNTKFDREYRNVLRFDTREAQEKYFNLPSLFSNAENINFNAGSLLETTMIYRIRENETLNDILSKNYCIVQDLNENRTLQYYFFFVRNAMQDVGGQVKLWLELDIFQTYYIDLNFTPCNIQKAHLNRFIDVGDGKVKFDGGIDSKLFEREDIRNVAKRLTKRQTISMYEDDFNGFTDEVKEWLATHVKAWVYAFIDATHKYDLPGKVEGKNVEFETTKIEGLNGNVLETSLCAVCVPISTDGGIIFEDDNGKRFAFGYSSLQLFMNDNEGANYIFSMKLSSNPPFYLRGLGSAYFSIEGSNLIIKGVSRDINLSQEQNNGLQYSMVNTGIKVVKDLDPFGFAMFFVKQQKPFLELKCENDFQYEFEKTEIVGAQKSYKFNPKLLNSDYCSLNIGNENGNFEYDVQKLNKNNLSILYTEPLTPDITKVYVRLKGEENSIYLPETSQNFTGFVDNNDTSMVLVSSQFQNMLAQNKNFFQQNSINRTFAGVMGGLGAGASLGTGLASLPTGGLGAIAAGVVGGIGAIAGVVKSSINEQLSVDNMKSAPASIQNAKGNAHLNFMTTPIGVIIEEYDILPNEKNIINDYMCLYGFTANFVDDLKKYDNIRKFYNYIQAEIEETTGINISNAVHDKFRQAFRNGVRFWNSDNFNFEKENYERWLENG